MDKFLLQIINMSITSSYVILVIVAIRFTLKKAPKIFSYGLWMIPFFRLIFPFSFESVFSLISINTETIPKDIIYTKTPQIQSGITAIDTTVNRVLPMPVVEMSVNPIKIWLTIGSIIWIIGLVTLLVYSIYSTFRLSKKLKSAALLHDNIYRIDTIKTAFVFGLMKPKIYLPNNLSKNEESYIIKHEQTHIKRLDHIIKFIAFLIVSIHWFNPIVWIAYYLMGEDMELSCDESVIREMGYKIKKDYSNSLLSLSIGKRIIGGSPIAFGENNTKGRIKNILNYKEPKFWVIVVAIVLIVALGVGLLSNPPDDENMTIGHLDNNYVNEEYGFSFKIPENWEEKKDKIKIIEQEEGRVVTFAYLFDHDGSENQQDFFTISIMSKEDYEEALMDSPMTGVHLAEKGNQVYVLYTPLDNIILDKDTIAEYIELNLSLEEIKERFYLNDSDSIGNLTNNMSVEDYAWQYIDNKIEMYENAEFGSFKVIDKKIINLEKLSTFDNILSSPVELWKLEYRLKPENPEKVMLAGGMNMIDGWLTEDSSMGKPNLVFTYDNDNLLYLGNLTSQDIYSLDTLASQEIAIRQMLESIGLLPNDTYSGTHVVIKFPLSTGETSQLLLSQPMLQGNSGIWAVERWMDGNGYIYYHVPSFEEDIKIDDYYYNLQDEVINGQNTWLRNPVEVGYNYIINTLGQVLVKMDDLEVIHTATIGDFLNTPESHHIGYITMMTLEESLFHLDKVEFLTQEDEERAAELGLDINYDMPSGFYIYNPNEYPDAFEVSEETEYRMLDYMDNYQSHMTLTKKDFIQQNDILSYHPLYHIYTKDGYVTRIIQQYIP